MPRQKKQIGNTSDIINFYNVIPKKYLEEVDNPNEHLHDIKIPFRMCIVAPSGSGKTNFLLNLIRVFAVDDKLTETAVDTKRIPPASFPLSDTILNDDAGVDVFPIAIVFVPDAFITVPPVDVKPPDVIVKPPADIDAPPPAIVKPPPFMVTPATVTSIPPADTNKPPDVTVIPVPTVKSPPTVVNEVDDPIFTG